MRQNPVHGPVFIWLFAFISIKQYIISLEHTIALLIKKVEALEKRTEKLESSVNKNSQNSSKPPSSDSPFKKPENKRKKSKRKKGARKGHKGHKQELLEPTQQQIILLEDCDCGCATFIPGTLKPYYPYNVTYGSLTSFKIRLRLCDK